MVDRRKFLLQTTAFSAGIMPNGAFSTLLSMSPLKVLVAGGHPDDPETGMGGTIRKLVNAGHHVSVLYLTTGEAGIPGTGHDEAAAIRKKEAEAACQILGATPHFFGQIDGESRVANDDYGKMRDWYQSIQPDILFTHWPVDTHKDHRHCSLLVLDAWLAAGRSAGFFYYEVMSGIQSMNFRPSHYVNITEVVQLKWEACFTHVSQKIRDSYHQDHARMEVFRGMESGCDYAEAFIQADGSPQVLLP